jgi:hypothetical protein
MLDLSAKKPDKTISENFSFENKLILPEITQRTFEKIAILNF